MSTPVIDNNDVQEAIDLLTSMFKGQPNIEGILKSIVAEIQTFENAVFVYLAGIQLVNAVGDALDKYGKIVDEPRNGRLDPEYRQGILIRIAVNDSQGKAEDLLNIAALAFGVGNFSYDEGLIASWELYALDSIGFPFISRDFHDAKAAGTRGVVIYSTWPTDEDFVYSSVYGAVSNAKGYSSTYGAPAVSGKYVTCLGV